MQIEELSLSPKQEILIDIAEENGVLKIRDLRKIYASEYYALGVVRRLVKLNYLRKLFFLNRWVLTE